MRFIRLVQVFSVPDEPVQANRPSIPVPHSGYRAAVSILLLGLACSFPAEHCWAWDATATNLLILDPAATAATAQADSLAGKLSFYQGTPLKLGCYYKYQNGTDQPQPWRVKLTVDGKEIGSVPAHGPKIATITKRKEYVSTSGITEDVTTELKLIDETYYAEAKWTALGEGPRNVQCFLNPDKVAGEASVSNNIAQQTIIVKRFKQLSGSDLPPVNLSGFANYSSFVLKPTLQIPLKATASPQATGGLANVVDYARASPFDENWRIQVVRLGSSGVFDRSVSEIGEFEGSLDRLNFDAQITLPWLQQHGATAGKYIARAYLSQTVAGKIVEGPDSRMVFELQETLQAQAALQPVGGSTPASGSPVSGQMPKAEPARGSAPTDSRSTMPPQDPAVREEMIKRTVSIRPPEPGSTGGTSERRTVSPGGVGQRTPGAATGQPVQMEFEAESLAKSGAIQTTGGNASVQSMGAFGNSWSGNEQVFWNVNAVGAVLDLIVEVPAASKYAVEIYMTRAPDYGQLSFEIDGKASGLPFDGVAPQVMPSGPTQLGTFPLLAGTRRISLMVTGKNMQSTGYYAGIDKVRLYPAGPIN